MGHGGAVNRDPELRQAGVRAARVTLSTGPAEVPLLPPHRLTPGGRRGGRPARSVRPVLPPRIGAEGALAVLADAEADGRAVRDRADATADRFLTDERTLTVGTDMNAGARADRFLTDGRIVTVGAGTTAGLRGDRFLMEGRTLVVRADTDAVGRHVVDFQPDGDGGLHLLEFLEDRGGAWLNRLRHVDATGATTWSRQGALDFQRTDPRRLVGVYTRLHRTRESLWLVPKATTAGLADIDPADGRTLAVVPLDADLANLVISAADQAIYALLVGSEIVLATTDLRTGRTALGEPAPVPLLDLAGTDSEGRVYARTPSGVAVLDPAGTAIAELTLCGAVTEQERLFVAYDGPVVEYGATGAPEHTWSLPGTGAVLVAVQEGPRFVFHPGPESRLVTRAADGRPVAELDDPEAVARELERVGSRMDLRLSAVTPDGAVLVPFSEPGGHRLLHLEPVLS
jgi:hypothetical protein